MKKLDQPKIKMGVRYTGSQPFVVQQPADPEAHLSEEQKKWPLIGGWEPLPESAGPPPYAQYAEPQPKTPPAQ